ncbi:DUF4339 domain-containing protein [Verrucomicrobium sp. BvORR034]|uniref:DUF4339 domain-containing protein n=1 Tax=Verrucomicrobium sp. BvORR034 TaxID=1396418 RepID=UPI0006786D5A|nr:DUF4339 domain-containing protein [Verrucomicrobium sp. BvORR034]
MGNTSIHSPLQSGPARRLTILRNGQSMGPFDTNAVQEMLRTGLLLSTDSARTEDSQGWRPVEEVLTHLVRNQLPASWGSLNTSQTPSEGLGWASVVQRVFSSLLITSLGGGVAGLSVAIGQFFWAGLLIAFLGFYNTGRAFKRTNSTAQKWVLAAVGILGAFFFLVAMEIVSASLRPPAPSQTRNPATQTSGKLPASDSEVFAWIHHPMVEAARKCKSTNKNDQLKYQALRSRSFALEYEPRKQYIDHFLTTVVTDPDLQEYLRALPSAIELMDGGMKQMESQPQRVLENQANLMRLMRITYLEHILRQRYAEAEPAFSHEVEFPPQMAQMMSVIPRYSEITPYWVETTLLNQNVEAERFRSQLPRRGFPSGIMPRN